MNVAGVVRARTPVTQEKKWSHRRPFPNTLPSGDPLIEKDMRDQAEVIFILQTFQHKHSRKETIHTQSDHRSEGGGERRVPLEGR